MPNSVNPDQSAPPEAEIDLGLHYFLRPIFEALPGFSGNRGKRTFISGEQGNKCQILRRTISGNREHKKTNFQFWGTSQSREQVPPWEGLICPNSWVNTVVNETYEPGLHIFPRDQF